MGAYNWRGWTQPPNVLRALERALGKKGRLWIAVTYRDAKAVRKLLRRGADPLYRDEATGLTLFRQAALRGDVEIAEALAEAGALAAEIEEDSGRGAIFSAVVRGHRKMVAYLVKAGADPIARDEYGRTALMKAIEVDKSAIATWLVKRCGDPDAVDEAGNTALHHACQRGKLGVVKALLKAGADSGLANGDGQLPAELAYEEKILELLSSTSAQAE